MTMFGRDQFYQEVVEQSVLPKPSKVRPPSWSLSSTSTHTSPQRPKKQAQAKSQRYIPGLNNAEDPNVVVAPNATTRRHLPTEITPAFVESYLEGTKQPISALMEYGTAVKIVIVFEECRVAKPSVVAKFANRVKANGKPFPQGVGKTKKEAKTAAAKIALNMFLGLEEGGLDDQDDETASISKASILTSTTFEPQVELPSVEEAGVRPLWDPPKHPVSRFTEYCSLNALDIEWKVSDKPTDIGFKAEVHVNDGMVAQAYALNKKDAKKLAAEIAIQKMCPQHLNSVANSESTKPSKPQPLKLWTAPAPQQPVGGMPFNPHASSMPRSPPRSPPQLQPKGDYVKALQDFSLKHGTPIELRSLDDPNDGGYEAYVNVDGTAIAFAHAGTKDDAMSQAAEEALTYLCKQLLETPQPSLESLPYHDRIAAQAHRMLDTLLAPTNENSVQHPYLAAFIIRKAEGDIGQVVAIGTGNTCVPNEARSTEGRVLNDCHFVVVARRALLKYLHRELKLYFDGNLINSIFEPLEGTSLLTFKSTVTIHLYLSRAPCGDASLYTTEPDGPLTPEDAEIMNQNMHYPSFPDDNSGYTSTKHERGFTVSLASEESPKWGDMSCSEKILKWNTTGLQGALFGHFLGPLYITSITMGSMYDHGNLSRAVAGRLTDGIMEYLPPGYDVNRPHLGRVTNCDPYNVQDKVCPESINWSFGDEKIEIVNGSTGISCERSPFRTSTHGASRVCKAGFLFRFREIAKLSRRLDLLRIPTYGGCKAASTEYQKAKRTLIEHLELTGFGFWVHKQQGFEQFSK